MTDWVTTRRERVEIHLSDRRVLTGDIHLQPLARHHAGPETPADFMNRDGELFFALVLDEEQPVFIARRQVLYLQVPRPASVDPDRASAARRVELEIELVDGTLLEGVVMMELPSDRPRALDFLNSTPAF